MIPVQRIGHATYSTPDLDRQVAYYTTVVGFTVSDRSRDRAILSTRLGQEVMVLEQASSARCTGVSFQVATDFDLVDALVHFSKRGIRCERRSDITAGIADAVVFEDPKGTEIELFTSSDESAPRGEVRGVAPMKLGHQAFIGRDAKRDHRILCDQGAGLSRVRLDGGLLLLPALRPGPPHGQFPHRKIDVVMHHVAYELKDLGHLQTACETVRAERCRSCGVHCATGSGHNISDLSPRTRRSHRRVLYRARPDEERSARLFRSAPMARGPAAAAEGLGPAFRRDHLGYAADSGISARPPRHPALIETIAKRFTRRPNGTFNRDEGHRPRPLRPARRAAVPRR